MGLTSSLFSGLSGMKSNEFRMDVIGNNIANVNTYSFKASRTTFQSTFYNTFTFGSAPNGAMGGTNPKQVGTGVMVGAVNRDFSGGAPETTGNKTDLAVQGAGMFVLERPDGSQVYTRDGSFQFNAENYLLSADGYFLKGYGIDSGFNIVEGTLSNLRIPLGEITTAAVTSRASFSGDLNGEGTAATARSQLTSQALKDTVVGVAATDATLLVNLLNADGTKLFEDKNVITLSKANKGGADLPQESFVIGTDGTTLGHLAAWLEDVMGITTAQHVTSMNLASPLPTIAGVPAPGVTISSGINGGKITIVGNIGAKNDIVLESGAIQVAAGAGVAPPNSIPFSFAKSASATGESIRTSFRAYDSLGIPVDIDITMVMQAKDNNGITWRYFAESSNDTDADRVVGTGLINFDTAGNYLDGEDLNIVIDHQNTGADTPQTTTLDFSTMDGFAMVNTMALLSQDGFQAGTLQDFSVGEDGVIVGSFTNGLTRNLGQVVLATFRNYEGLVAMSDNLYGTGPNSGSALIRKPQELGAGTINAAALELSNVDLSREFINLIVSSTGFSASSRVIQTSDRLLSELMQIAR